MLSSVALAQQAPPEQGTELHMQRQLDGQQLLFIYQFVDIEGNRQRLEFSMPRQQVVRTPTAMRPLSQPRLLREIAALQRDYAHQQGWRDARLSQSNGQLHYQLMQGSQSSKDARLQQWQAAEQEAFEEVLRRHYYQPLQQHAGPSGYTPDHPRVASESQALMQPLSHALSQLMREQYGNYTPRQALAYVNQFIQQIPYDDFTNRLASPGAGFIAPGRLLYENRGDCDSKVTLLAALMANLFPDIERRIVYLPNHAVFALQMEAQPANLYVRDGELAFVIADPTGPAQHSVGDTARAYHSHIRSGALTLLAI